MLPTHARPTARGPVRRSFRSAVHRHGPSAIATFYAAFFIFQTTLPVKWDVGRLCRSPSKRSLIQTCESSASLAPRRSQRVRTRLNQFEPTGVRRAARPPTLDVGVGQHWYLAPSRHRDASLPITPRILESAT